MGKHAAPASGAKPPSRGPTGSGDGTAAAADARPGSPPTTAAGRFWSGTRETAVLLALALGLAVVLRTFVLQAFYVPSESMVPTLRVDDRIVASKLSTDIGGVDRGEVVVFRDPGGWLDPPVNALTGPRKLLTSVFTFIGLLPSDSGDDLVKRVIGVAGDHVVCCNAKGKITVNGYALDESGYLDPGDVPSQTPFDVTVPPDHIWVMGDNRNNSQDSRYHEQQKPGGGMVPVGNVIGRAVVIVWPAGHWHTLPVPATFDDVPPPASTNEDSTTDTAKQPKAAATGAPPR